MNQTIQYGVGERGLADIVMPELDRQLGGDERGAMAMAVVEQLQQVAALGGAHRSNAEIVDRKKLGAGQRAHELGVAPVAVGKGELLGQARPAPVAHAVVLATGAVGERTGEEGLAAAGGAFEDQIEPIADPLGGGKLGDERFVQPPRGAPVDVLDTGARVAQLRGAQPGAQAPVGAGGEFAVDEQAEALLEAEFADIGHALLLDERGVHAAQAQLLEFIQGRVGEHGGGGSCWRWW